MSMVEVVTNAMVGFVTSVPVNFAILPLFGAPVKLGASMGITLAFTVVSVVRSYLVRRFFAVYIKRFAHWCQDFHDDMRSLGMMT